MVFVTPKKQICSLSGKYSKFASKFTKNLKKNEKVTIDWENHFKIVEIHQNHPSIGSQLNHMENCAGLFVCLKQFSFQFGLFVFVLFLKIKLTLSTHHFFFTSYFGCDALTDAWNSRMVFFPPFYFRIRDWSNAICLYFKPMIKFFFLHVQAIGTHRNSRK